MDDKAEIKSLLPSESIVTERLARRRREDYDFSSLFPVVSCSGALLPACSFALTVVLSVTWFWNPYHNFYMMTIYIYLIVLLCISLLLLLLTVTCRNKFRPKIMLKPAGTFFSSNWKIQTAEEQQRIARLTLFFAAGALAYSVWKVVADSLCTDPMGALKWLSLLYGVLKCLFIVFLGVFLCAYATGLFYRRSPSGLMLIVIMSCNVSVWTFEMSAAVFGNAAQNLTLVHPLPRWFCFESAAQKSLFIVTPYLYPWVMEYTFVTTALLAWLWYASGRIFKMQTNWTEPENDSTSFSFSHSTLDDGKPTGCTSNIASCSFFSCSCFRRRTRTDCGMVVGILLAILFAGMILVASMLENKSATRAASLGFYGVRIGTDLIMMLCCLFTCLALNLLQPTLPEINQQLEKRTYLRELDEDGNLTYWSTLSEETALVFGDWLTYIAATGVVAYESFSFYASAVTSAKHQDDPSSLKTVNAVTCVVAALLQAAVLLRSRRCLSTLSQVHRKRTVVRNLQQAVLILVSGNVCLWATDSIFQIQSTQHWAIESKFYSRNSWDFITNLFYPLQIFFRFYSSVTLFNLWSRSRRFDFSDSSNIQSVN